MLRILSYRIADTLMNPILIRQLALKRCLVCNSISFSNGQSSQFKTREFKSKKPLFEDLCDRKTFVMGPTRFFVHLNKGITLGIFVSIGSVSIKKFIDRRALGAQIALPAVFERRSPLSLRKNLRI